MLSQDETPATLLVGFVALRAGLGPRVSDLIDLPEHYDLAVPLRTDPPSSFACFMVSQKGETYFVAESKNRLTPRYAFFDTTLRGSPVALHGRRQGTIPCSSRLTIFSVTIA